MLNVDKDIITEKLKLVTWGIAGFWLFAQIILMFCHFGPQQGDWGTYIHLAHRCCDAREWYPMKCDLYSEYILYFQYNQIYYWLFDKIK